MNDPRAVEAVALSSVGWGALSRRRFLKSVLALAAAGAGATTASCARGGGVGAGGRPFLFLDDGEAAIVAALGEVIIPTQPGFPSLEQAQVLRRFDEELSFVGESIRGDLHAALGLLQVAPFLYGRFSRYSKLPRAGRREILTRLLQSRSETLRAVGINLKLLVHFFYFGHASTWPVIGYDGPFAHLPPIESEQRRWYAEQTRGAGS